MKDAIVAVDGKVLPVPTSKRSYNRAVRKANEMLRDASDDGTMVLRVSRTSGELVDVPMELARACDYPVVVTDSDALNAYADGEAVYITSGMVRFATNDLELQTVIAHELAHNTEGHSAKAMRNAALGGILGAIVDVAAATQGVYTGGDATGAGMRAGAGAFSQDFEREADYVGIYFMERAGIDSAEAATFWRRMAAENPDAVVYGRTHPTTPERFVNITATSAEVRAKRDAGDDLLPTRKRE